MARKAAGLALENSRALLKTCYGRLPSSSSSLPRPEERLLGVGGGRLALQNVDVCAPASSYPAPQASREGHFSGICERKGHLRSRSTQYQQLFRIAPSASCSIKSGQWSTSQWSETSRGYHRRSLSLAPYTNGKRKFLIDTLALVRKLEAQGLSAQQAEGITDLIAQIMNETMDDLAQNFVSKQEMQMTVMKAETEFSRFKNDMKSLQEQNHDSLRREMERLKTEIEKIRSELN